ncbi:MAG: iron-sulfur cluster assembly scaffold protein [Candidatus Woesearchaeota archaeon]
MYNEKVMEHFKNPRNAGELADANGCGKVGNPSCGDVMLVQIKVEDGRITDAKFKTFGCCAAISASDAVCELVKGKTLEEAAKLTKDDIVKFLGDLPCVKIHCSILGIDGLKKAIEDYKANNAVKV